MNFYFVTIFHLHSSQMRLLQNARPRKSRYHTLLALSTSQKRLFTPTTNLESPDNDHPHSPARRLAYTTPRANTSSLENHHASPPKILTLPRACLLEKKEKKKNPSPPRRARAAAVKRRIRDAPPGDVCVCVYTRWKFLIFGGPRISARGRGGR